MKSQFLLLSLLSATAACSNSKVSTSQVKDGEQFPSFATCKTGEQELSLTTVTDAEGKIQKVYAKATVPGAHAPFAFYGHVKAVHMKRNSWVYELTEATYSRDSGVKSALTQLEIVSTYKGDENSQVIKLNGEGLTQSESEIAGCKSENLKTMAWRQGLTQSPYGSLGGCMIGNGSSGSAIGWSYYFADEAAILENTDPGARIQLEHIVDAVKVSDTTYKMFLFDGEVREIVYANGSVASIKMHNSIWKPYFEHCIPMENMDALVAKFH